jgi:hypothetical protein
MGQGGRSRNSCFQGSDRLRPPIPSTVLRGPLTVLVASSDRPRPAQGPATGNFILLTYSGFVREPYFYLVPIDALLAGDLVQNGRPFF